MNIHEKVIDELCPNGIWRFSETVAKLFTRYINRLPETKVSGAETRYPTSLVGMRAFFETFFARHYFQVQNSLLNYMTSDEFAGSLRAGKLNILDIGCGPAVASLAITDLLGCIFRHLTNAEQMRKSRKLRVNYTLNDTEGVCLGIAQELIRDYFRLNVLFDKNLCHERTFVIQKDFPENLIQLKRICEHVGFYDLIILSYVINPLNEEIGPEGIAHEIEQLELMCDISGRILVVQDKFSVSLIRKVSKYLGESVHTDVIRQKVYSVVNNCDEYAYKYHYCLLQPNNNLKCAHFEPKPYQVTQLHL